MISMNKWIVNYSLNRFGWINWCNPRPFWGSMDGAAEIPGKTVSRFGLRAFHFSVLQAIILATNYFNCNLCLFIHTIYECKYHIKIGLIKSNLDKNFDNPCDVPMFENRTLEPKFPED